MHLASWVLFWGLVLRCQVLLNVMKLESDRHCLALGKNGKDLSAAVHDMIRRLSHGHGPKKSDVLDYDSFFRMVCKGLKNFCAKNVTMGGGGEAAGSGKGGIL